jgi:hypothetical protein
MRYFRILGERMMKRLPFKTWRRVLARARLAIERSGSAKNKLLETAFVTSG